MTDSDDFDQYIEGLLAGKKPSQATITKVCEKAKEVLSQEPNVVSLRAPMTICGNVSGELENLLEIFNLVGKPPEANFVFMGTYFLRGPLGVETFSLVLALKVRYRNRVTLLRGMGEDIPIGQTHGFYNECEAKYGNYNVWRLFADIFNYLPLSAVVDDTYFCLPGGLTLDVLTIDHIQQLDRFRYYVSPDNKVHEMLGSEPGDDDEEWRVSYRGYGYLFPKKASKMFNHMNNLKMICRVRLMEMKGYSYAHDNRVLSISSAPHYLDRGGNFGALVEVDEYSGTDIVQFYFQRKTQVTPLRDLDYFSKKNIVSHYNKLDKLFFEDD